MVLTVKPSRDFHPSCPTLFLTFQRSNVQTFQRSSHPVRNCSFHPLEKEQSSDQHQHNRRRRRQQQRPRPLSVACQRPPETVNHSRHGIQSVQPPPLLRNQRRRVRHRRSKHPELHQKWHNVFHVAIQCIQRRHP